VASGVRIGQRGWFDAVLRADQRRGDFRVWLIFSGRNGRAATGKPAPDQVGGSMPATCFSGGRLEFAQLAARQMVPHVHQPLRHITAPSKAGMNRQMLAQLCASGLARNYNHANEDLAQVCNRLRQPAVGLMMAS
jgi:hypothetical protein